MSVRSVPPSGNVRRPHSRLLVELSIGIRNIASSSRSVDFAPDRRWRAPVEPVRAVGVGSGANEPWP